MGKKVIKLTETELKEIVSDTVSKILEETISIGEFDNAVKKSVRLDEMARVGFIGGEYEVYVWTDDAGHIPHVHVRDTNSKGKNFETCIELNTNRYFLHGGYDGTFSSKERKAFAEFMEAPCKNKRYDTNFEYAVDMWNDNNSTATVQIIRNKDGKVIIPNYRTII